MVGGRVFGWRGRRCRQGTPSRDPCASLCGVSLAGFRDRGIGLEAIRKISIVEMVELTIGLRSNRAKRKCT